MSVAEWSQWIERDDDMPLTTQCELASVRRSTVCRQLEAAARQQCLDEEDGQLRTLIDEAYTDRPFYGRRRMMVLQREEIGRLHRYRFKARDCCVPQPWRLQRQYKLRDRHQRSKGRGATNGRLS